MMPSRKKEIPYIKVMMPCYSGLLYADCAESLLHLTQACDARGISLDWDLRDGGADIVRAREYCVEAFLSDPAATHLLFIDADIGFAPEQVFRLLEFGAEFAAAAYPLKGLFWDRLAIAARDGDADPSGSFRYALAWAEGGHVKTHEQFAAVRSIGIGFALLRRSALTRLAEASAAASSGAGVGAPDGAGTGGLFGCMIDPDTGIYLSECFAFCRRWTELGGEIWVDLHSRLTHIGPFSFRGDLFSQLEPVSETEEA